MNDTKGTILASCVADPGPGGRSTGSNPLLPGDRVSALNLSLPVRERREPDIFDFGPPPEDWEVLSPQERKHIRRIRGY